MSIFKKVGDLLKKKEALNTAGGSAAAAAAALSATAQGQARLKNLVDSVGSSFKGNASIRNPSFPSTTIFSEQVISPAKPVVRTAQARQLGNIKKGIEMAASSSKPLSAKLSLSQNVVPALDLSGLGKNLKISPEKKGMLKKIMEGDAPLLAMQLGSSIFDIAQQNKEAKRRIERFADMDENLNRQMQEAAYNINKAEKTSKKEQDEINKKFTQEILKKMRLKSMMDKGYFRSPLQKQKDAALRELADEKEEEEANFLRRALDSEELGGKRNMFKNKKLYFALISGDRKK